ncbi:MAG: serine/threonine-protein kinase [Acidobacteriaceae bacterium]|nr:serine/threonine-protein kinase [Acidobacteriaceae bacterium]
MFPLRGNPITDEKWKCAYELFERALELPASERLIFTQSATSDPEVLRLALELIEDTQDEDSEESAGLVLKAGDRIGRYQVIGKLGQGGIGSVYSARDTDLRRTAALKVLAPGLGATELAAERLVREARAASALNHPQIVTVYEVIRLDRQVALAMELVEGKSLRKYCGEAQPAVRVIDWGRQIAQALAAAHEHGIVHGDIKPENLMVRPDGYIKVLDFGLARQLRAAEQTGSTNSSGVPAGTLNYMSPEQTRGQRPTQASDIFSLGLMLYELATGAHPFATDSPIDTAHAIAHNTLNPASALSPKIPEALDRLIGSMLAKDPGKRPSAEEVVSRFNGMIEADRKDTPRRVKTWWWVSGLAACIVCGLALWAIAAKIFTPKEPVLQQITTQISENRVAAAALSPDGKELAFGTMTGSVLVRRMSDGFTRPLRAPAGLQVDRIAWFTDGSRRLLASGTAADHRRGVWVIPLNGGAAGLIVPEGEDGVPSPDGTRIASTGADGTTIWVTGVNGARPRQIRGGGGTNSFSALIWSPDGKRISYQRHEYAPPRDRQIMGYGASRPQQNAYNYEAADANTGRVVASVKDVVMTSACGLGDGRVLYLRWVSVMETRIVQLWDLRTDPKTGKVLGPPRQLTHSPDLMLSSISAAHDGSKVALVRRSEYSNIYIADLPPDKPASKLLNIRRLTFALADEYPHAWTPDNAAVIFESNRNGTFGLFRQKIDEREPEPLVLSNADSVLPQASPDGKWILYREDREQRSKRTLMRVPMDGGTPEPVPKTGNVEEFRCGRQPGSRCVVRSTENDQFVFYELDPLRGKGRELARTGWSPWITGDWELSPDGLFIAIPNHDPQNAKIRVISLDATEPDRAERVVTLDGMRNLHGVAWGAGGEWYVTEKTPLEVTLFDVDSDGHSWELLKSTTTLFAVPSLDGRKIAFPQNIASSNVWLIKGF